MIARLSELLARLGRLWARRRGLDDDLSEEIRAHIDLAAQHHIERGMSPQAAQAAAAREFGNPTSVRERAHEAWQFPRFETFLLDVRYALRGIRKAPGFAAVVALTLALGIGANTAIFSVVYAVLLRPLPYPSGERLVWLAESTKRATGISATWINFQHWRKESPAFVDMAGFAKADVTLTGRGDAQLLHAGTVTGSFFRLTGQKPLLGALPGDADNQPGAPPTVLLAYSFWAHTLGSDGSIIGKDLTLNGKAFQVIGVLGPQQNFLGKVDCYLALGRTAGRTMRRSQHGSMRVLGLLRPGVTLAQASAGLDDMMKRLAAADPGPEDDHRVYAKYLADETIGETRSTLWLLMGAVGLVLLLACANVASLLLVRNTARAREIAIRTAIGAGRGRMVRQLLTENLVLAAVGGALGVGLAAAGLQALVGLAPVSIPRLAEAALDLPVLVFASVATLLVGCAAGLAPVFGSRRMDLTVSLREGAAGSGTGRRGHAVRSVLVMAEIAVTLVLTFGSGLLIRSLLAAQSANPGFESRHLLALELQLPPSRYRTPEQIHDYFEKLTDGLRRQPGVESVGSVNCPPSAGDCSDYWYSVLDRPTPAREDVPLALFNYADAAYFGAMRIPLRSGRVFDATDRAVTEPVVVVNETFARRWWKQTGQAVGQMVKVGGPYMEGQTYRIVGVVGDVSQMGLDRKPEPEVYYSFAQRPSSAMVVLMRTAGDPAMSTAGVRRIVGAQDANVPIQSLRPFETWIQAPLDQRRFTTLLLGIFAGLAMLLASVGVYGVLNYWVSVRHREIAVRMAVGAQRGAILRWAGAHTARLTGVGVGAGVLGSAAVSGWLRNMVFGVSERSPWMLLLAAALVVAIALVAAGLPLWRATRVDVLRNLHDA